MKVEIRIEPDGDVWALRLALVNPDSPVTHVVDLQTGYSTPAQALDSLIECLTYTAPPFPDLSGYELGLEKVGELATTMEEVTAAISTLGERMNDVEDRTPAAPATAWPNGSRKPLLPGRATAGPPMTASRPAPPSIRRPTYTKDLPTEQQELPARVHGQFFGGPSRRGGTMTPTQHQDDGGEDNG